MNKRENKNNQNGVKIVSTKMKSKWMATNYIAIKVQRGEEALEEGQDEDKDIVGDIEAALFKVKEISKNAG